MMRSPIEQTVSNVPAVGSDVVAAFALLIRGPQYPSSLGARPTWMMISKHLTASSTGIHTRDVERIFPIFPDSMISLTYELNQHCAKYIST